MRHLKTVLAVLGAATILVLAANTVALATTGKALIAGKINKSAKMTAIVRTTPGTGLQVKTKSAANSPFAVNGKGKVANLNVDKVDGLDGGTRAYRWSAYGEMGEQKNFKLSGLPVGNYLMTFEAYLGGGIDPAATGDCYFYTDSKGKGDTYRYAAESSTPRGFYTVAAITGTGFVTQTAGDITGLICRVSAGTFSIGASQPIRVTAIPIAGVTGKSFSRLVPRSK
jgi:hypothetical protein